MTIQDDSVRNDVDNIFECGIKECSETVTQLADRYCSAHRVREQRFGSPTPLIPCYGNCGSEFVWIGPAFRVRAYCDDCIEFLKRYEANIPVHDTTVLKHGIVMVEYLKLLEAQDFKCKFWEICGAEFRPGPDKNNRLHIDHDHNCCPGHYGCRQCIRGLLCQTCNAATGYIEKYPEIINRLKVYKDERPFATKKEKYNDS